MFAVTICKGPHVLSSGNHFFTIPSRRNLDFLNLQAITPSFKQFTWDGASNFHYSQIRSFKQASADSNYCTVILPKSANIKQVLICDWLITWQSIYAQFSNWIPSNGSRCPGCAKWGKDTANKGQNMPWHHLKTLLHFWAAQFLRSWHVHWELPFYFNTGSNSIISEMHFCIWYTFSDWQ